MTSRRLRYQLAVDRVKCKAMACNRLSSDVWPQRNVARQTTVHSLRCWTAPQRCNIVTPCPLRLYGRRYHKAVLGVADEVQEREVDGSGQVRHRHR